MILCMENSFIFRACVRNIFKCKARYIYIYIYKNRAKVIKALSFKAYMTIKYVRKTIQNFYFFRFLFMSAKVRIIEIGKRTKSVYFSSKSVKFNSFF